MSNREAQSREVEILMRGEAALANKKTRSSQNMACSHTENNSDAASPSSQSSGMLEDDYNLQHVQETISATYWLISIGQELVYILRYVWVARGDLPVVTDISDVRQLIQRSGIEEAPSQELDSVVLPLLVSSTKSRNFEIVAYLLPKLSSLEIPEDLVLVAIDTGLEMYKLYLNHSPIIFSYDWQGMGDVLCRGIKRGETSLLKYVLSSGGDPGRTLDSQRIGLRFLPMEFVAYSLWISSEVLLLLIEYGAKVKGTYALQLAASCGCVDKMRLLLEAGADVDGLPETGFEVLQPDGSKTLQDIEFHEPEGTALHVGASAGFVEVVRLLLGAGADRKGKDIDGRTALERAKQAGHEEIAAMLSK